MREETRCCHIGYSFRLTARVLLYASSHRQYSTYHSLCYTSCGALAGTRNSSMGPPHEGLIRRPIAPQPNKCPWLIYQRLWYVMSCLWVIVYIYNIPWGVVWGSSKTEEKERERKREKERESNWVCDLVALLINILEFIIFLQIH